VHPADFCRTTSKSLCTRKADLGVASRGGDRLGLPLLEETQIISQNAVINSFYEVNSPTKIVNLVFTITNCNNKLADLCADLLLQTRFSEHFVREKRTLVSRPVEETAWVFHFSRSTCHSLSQSAICQSFLSQSVMSQSFQGESVISKSFLSQSVIIQSVMSQSFLRQSVLSQSVTRQSFLSQSVISQSFLSQSVKSQSFISQSFTSQSFLSQSVISQSFPSQSVKNQPFISQCVISQSVMN